MEAADPAGSAGNDVNGGPIDGRVANIAERCKLIVQPLSDLSRRER